MAVGQSFLGSEQILGRDEGFVAQQAAEGLDFFLGPIGEVGQGALAGFVAFAPALAEEDGGRGVAVGDGFDVHGIYYAHLLIIVKDYMLITWEHFHRVKLGLRSNKSETYRRIWPDFFWNFGLDALFQKPHMECSYSALHQVVRVSSKSLKILIAALSSSVAYWVHPIFGNSSGRQNHGRENLRSMRLQTG